MPSISWTVDEHQAQCNLGYLDEDDNNGNWTHVDNSLHAHENQNIENYGTNEDFSFSEKNNSEILKEFECPVCFNPMVPPLQIFQCSLGHALCSSCKSQGIEICPSCRKLVIGRAHNMENIARLLFTNMD